MSDSWTTAQAAFILEEPLDAFKKVLERTPVRPRVVKRGGLSVREFGLADLVYLHADRELRSELSPTNRKRLYSALLALPHHGVTAKVEFGDFTYKIGRHVKEVQAKVKQVDRLWKEIDSSGADPVIKGTTIEAHRIAALLDGMTVEEVLADYPSLNERQLLAAKAYAEAHPKPGRPYPKVTAKAAMRAADLEGLEAYMRPRE